MKLDFENSITGLISEIIINNIKEYHHVIVFGAGESGNWCRKVLETFDIHAVAFCDNSTVKQGTKKDGLDILSLQTVMETYKDCCICIASMWKEEIKNQIEEKYPFMRDRIFDLLTTMAWETSNGQLESYERNHIKDNIGNYEKIASLLEDQESINVLEGILNYRLTRDSKYLKRICSREDVYIDRSILKDKIDYLSSQWMIDGGAFDGDTIEYFTERLGDKRLNIIAYEAEDCNVKRLKTNIKRYGSCNVEIIDKALWDCAGERISFNGDGLSGSVNDSGVEVVTDVLDNLLSENRPVSYIKLDIEGAERNALRGGLADHTNISSCAFHLCISFTG